MPQSIRSAISHSAKCIAAVLLLGPIPSLAQTAEDTAGWPPWLQKAMAEESLRIRTRSVDVADGRYKFKLAGKPEKPEAIDGGWYLASDIKAESPLECYVFDDDMDLATLVVTLADLNIDATSTANGPVDNKSIYFLDAGAIDGVPFIALEWIYTVGEAPNALIGFTKVRAAINNGLPQACTHNFLGYRETFARAFEVFVRSARHTRNSAKPYYMEVLRQNLGDQPVGVAWMTYTLDVDGDTEVRTMDSALIPVDNSTISFTDSSTLSFSTPDGRLINEYTALVENGELVTNLELGRRDDGNWSVSGTFQGKPIEQTIDGDFEPVSDLGQMRIAKELFAGQHTSSTIDIWAPQIDPTQFLQASLSRDDDKIERQGKVVLGAMSMTAQFDKLGSILRSTMQMGAAELRMDRVWVDGAPQ